MGRGGGGARSTVSFPCSGEYLGTLVLLTACFVDNDGRFEVSIMVVMDSKKRKKGTFVRPTVEELSGAFL